MKFPSTVTFITMTTRHDLDLEEQILLLKEAHSRFFDKLEKWGMKRRYLSAMDFHESGYAHYHTIYFGKIENLKQLRLREMWERHNYGNYRKGLDFRVREDGKVARIVNYLFKHTGKILSGRGRPGWLRLNSVVWAMSHSREGDVVGEGGVVGIENYDYPVIRFFQISKDIGRIMKIEKGNCENLKFIDLTGGVIHDSYEKEQIKEFLDWFEKLKI